MLIKKLISFSIFVVCLTGNSAHSQNRPKNHIEPLKLSHPDLVNKFYSLRKQQVFWYASTTSPNIRHRFLQIIDSSEFYGLDKKRYNRLEFKESITVNDTLELIRSDRLFTDMVIAFCKDVYQGYNIQKWIKSDEVSAKYSEADNEYLLKMIASVNSSSEVDIMLRGLEPIDREYATLKNELSRQIISGNLRNTNLLSVSINLYRWAHHFQFDKFIVVNIPSATLRYYEKDSQRLSMNVVAGKPSTKSPRFATWCNQVVLYPYWNVPRSIAVKELLPRFRKNPAMIDEMDIQVIDKNGSVIDHHNINWTKYNHSNLPFMFRQCTGCGNSLGVIKFNLTDPFSVYMHDTNYKLAFLSKTRFFSHGCIRVEKPIELGNYLLNTIDSSYLKACLKDQKPVPINIDVPVPVFVVYMPAEAPQDMVVFYKDVYHLFSR